MPGSPPAGPDERRIRVDLVERHAVEFGHTPRQRGEFERLAEADELLAVHAGEPQGIERDRDIDIVDQFHELPRYPDPLHVLGQAKGFAALRLLDLVGPGQQRIEIAVGGEQLGRRLDPDAGSAWHVVGAVTGERLDIDDAVRRHAEISHDLFRAYATLVARSHGTWHARGGIVHPHLLADDLHQVLVGRDYQNVGARFTGMPGVGGDQVVGLVGLLLDRHHAEGPHGLPHERELRHEVFGRLVAMRLVVGVELLAKGVFALVEDDGEMGWDGAHRPLAHELQQLGREEPHRPCG